MLKTITFLKIVQKKALKSKNIEKLQNYITAEHYPATEIWLG